MMAQALGATKGDVTPDVIGVTPNVTPDERQKWILGELARDVRITRSDIEKRFAVTGRTVERDLTDMVKCGSSSSCGRRTPGIAA